LISTKIAKDENFKKEIIVDESFFGILTSKSVVDD
jgi:hypothetical protein